MRCFSAKRDAAGGERCGENERAGRVEGARIRAVEVETERTDDGRDRDGHADRDDVEGVEELQSLLGGRRRRRSRSSLTGRCRGRYFAGSSCCVTRVESEHVDAHLVQDEDAQGGERARQNAEQQREERRQREKRLLLDQEREEAGQQDRVEREYEHHFANLVERVAATATDRVLAETARDRLRHEVADAEPGDEHRGASAREMQLQVFARVHEHEAAREADRHRE